MRAVNNKDCILLVNVDAETEKAIRQLLGGIFHLVTRRMDEGLADLAVKPSIKLILYEYEPLRDAGFAFCQPFSADDQLRHVPVILLIEAHQVACMTEGFYRGVSDYIVKPLIPAEVLVRVGGQLELAATAVALHDMRSRQQRAKTKQNSAHPIGSANGASAHNEDTPKLLVVDDYPGNLKALAETLENIYDVTTADNGADAITRAKQQKFDLILLDIVMPGIDGYEVCRRLKQDPVTRDVPVIFLTGQMEAKDEIYGLEVGAVDYMLKPYNVAVLLARIKIHLNMSSYQLRLKRFSYLDGLTNIPNRRLFDELYEKETKRALREHNHLAVLLIDIDHFKRFNDHFGHAAGDQCLKRIAQTLADCQHRSGDFVGRYGGEEFVVLLPNVNPAGAKVVAEAMLDAVRKLKIAHAPSARHDTVTISIGAASCLANRQGLPRALLHEADLALYQVKARGGNSVKVHEVHLPTTEKLGPIDKERQIQT